MDDESIKAIVAEMTPLLTGRAPGKIFQLNPLSLAIDFRLRDGYLFISVEPGMPRLYLIKRRVRDLEKQSTASNQFALTLRKELSGTELQSIEKDAGDRIVRFGFVGNDELERPKERTLIAQLTGRSANLHLLNEEGIIIHQARTGRGAGQAVGETYQTPQSSSAASEAVEGKLAEAIRNGGSPSAAADIHFTSLLADRAFEQKSAAARGALRRKLAQEQKLFKLLEADLASHANAADHKRIGDLLLANVSTATRRGSKVELIDYFADNAPVIEIEVDEKLTLPQEAERRFALYSRSKRAMRQIKSRIAVAHHEKAAVESRQAELEESIAARDQAVLDALMSARAVAGSPREISLFSRGKAREKKIPGVRRYASSDGFEILVGRASRDNDHLTFKVAKPNDLWLHAADYGGSHVVVRNSTRKPIPHRTLVEAAQLAAKFSQARKDPKVDVHYTERKFVSKVKGTAPGLVRMSRFKNITVEPKEAVERI